MLSQATQPMELPAIAAQPEASGWDKFTSGLGDVWHGYQNLEIGPGAEKLSPEDRSKAFWGAKLQQIGAVARGGNGQAARAAYGQHYLRQNAFDAYLGPLEAAATTPEEKDRVAL